MHDDFGECESTRGNGYSNSVSGVVTERGDRDVEDESSSSD